MFVYLFLIGFCFDVLQTDELRAGFVFCFVFAFFSWAEIATNCECSRHRLSLCDTPPPPPHTPRVRVKGVTFKSVCCMVARALSLSLSLSLTHSLTCSRARASALSLCERVNAQPLVQVAHPTPLLWRPLSARARSLYLRGPLRSPLHHSPLAPPGI